MGAGGPPWLNLSMPLEPPKNPPPRRHHHGRQWPLGQAPGPDAGPGPRRRDGIGAGGEPPGPTAWASPTSPCSPFPKRTGSAPRMEIRALMALLRSYLRRDLAEMQAEQHRPQGHRRPQAPARERAAGTGPDHGGHCPGGARMALTLALSYGGRSEIRPGGPVPGPGHGGRAA